MEGKQPDLPILASGILPVHSVHCCHKLASAKNGYAPVVMKTMSSTLFLGHIETENEDKCLLHMQQCPSLSMAMCKSSKTQSV